MPGKLAPEKGRLHQVDLPDGEAVIVHDDQPADWIADGPTVVMVHGLGGCHRSGYMVRIAEKLNARGVRVFRMNLRGSGTGVAHATKPYHGGSSDDLHAVLRFIERLCPNSPITLLGFSLGGNIVLKLLGEAPDRVPSAVIRAAAVNPPIDLEQSVVALKRWSLRPYDRYFVSLLLSRLNERKRTQPEAPHVQFARPPKRLFDFDDLYTAPVSGFRDARDYYKQCSSQQFLAQVQVPTLILTSLDDPLISVSMFERQIVEKNLSPQIQIHIAEGGGHLGYLARSSHDPDERWLDWRMVDWVLA